MPQEHLEKLRKKHIKGIKKAYIFNCSCQEWLDTCANILKDMKPRDTDSYKMELSMYTKMNSKEYYEKKHNRYAKDLAILENPKSTRNQILKVFSRHDPSFDKDLKNGSYEMSGVGWCDNYRVWGNPYPCVTHHNAEEAIEWLEAFDNGNNICTDMTWGMCDELKEIIVDFFNEYPNGTIHYG